MWLWGTAFLLAMTACFNQRKFWQLDGPGGLPVIQDLLYHSRLVTYNTCNHRTMAHSCKDRKWWINDTTKCAYTSHRCLWAPSQDKNITVYILPSTSSNTRLRTTLSLVQGLCVSALVAVQPLPLSSPHSVNLHRGQQTDIQGQVELCASTSWKKRDWVGKPQTLLKPSWRIKGKMRGFRVRLWFEERKERNILFLKSISTGTVPVHGNGSVCVWVLVCQHLGLCIGDLRALFTKLKKEQDDTV